MSAPRSRSWKTLIAPVLRKVKVLKMPGQKRSTIEKKIRRLAPLPSRAR
jgi:hypothetical protein